MLSMENPQFQNALAIAGSGRIICINTNRVNHRPIWTIGHVAPALPPGHLAAGDAELRLGPRFS
jgi:hypothetical protein